VGVVASLPAATASIGVAGGGPLRFIDDKCKPDFHTTDFSWKEGEDALAEAIKKNIVRKVRKEPDPLEVIFDKKKTEQKVKKSELRALRIRYAKLQAEADKLRGEQTAEIYELRSKIKALEEKIRCLEEEALDLKPAYDSGLSNYETQHSVAKGITAALPYAVVAVAVGAGTYFLVPEDHPLLKTVGYTGAAVAGLFAVKKGFEGAGYEVPEMNGMIGDTVKGAVTKAMYQQLGLA
jgi:hypothetical protein